MFCFEFTFAPAERDIQRSVFRHCCSSVGRSPAEALMFHVGSPEITLWARSLFLSLGFKMPPRVSSITSAVEEAPAKTPDFLERALLELADGSIDTETLAELLEKLTNTPESELELRDSIDERCHRLVIWIDSGAFNQTLEE